MHFRKNKTPSELHSLTDMEKTGSGKYVYRLPTRDLSTDERLHSTLFTGKVRVFGSTEACRCLMLSSWGMKGIIISMKNRCMELKKQHDVRKHCH